MNQHSDKQPLRDASESDVVVLVRPSKYATDREWAEALQDDLWVAEERVMAAEGALRDIRQALAQWETDLAEAAQLAAESSEGSS